MATILRPFFTQSSLGLRSDSDVVSIRPSLQLFLSIWSSPHLASAAENGASSCLGRQNVASGPSTRQNPTLRMWRFYFRSPEYHVGPLFIFFTVLCFAPIIVFYNGSARLQWRELAADCESATPTPESWQPTANQRRPRPTPTRRPAVPASILVPPLVCAASSLILIHSFIPPLVY